MEFRISDINMRIFLDIVLDHHIIMMNDENREEARLQYNTVVQYID